MGPSHQVHPASTGLCHILIKLSIEIINALLYPKVKCIYYIQGSDRTLKSLKVAEFEGENINRVITGAGNL